MKGEDIMTQVNFRIDESVKASAESALKDMGLTLSTAINMFLVKVGREKRIPFEVTADPFYSEDNVRHLEQMLQEAADGKAHFAEHDLIEVD